MLNWQIDESAQFWANILVIDIEGADAHQYAGHEININLWKNLTLSRTFPNDSIVCSPENIMKCFQKDMFLEGLILTINWGGMSGTIESIYKQPLEDIHNNIGSCKKSILETNSIEKSWNLLTVELSWTNVMSSKLLHFLTRSLDYTNVPVPIDRAHIIGKIAKAYRGKIKEIRNNYPGESIPKTWGSSGYPNYISYMNTIIKWAEHYHISTTELESRIFNKYSVGQNPCQFL